MLHKTILMVLVLFALLVMQVLAQSDTPNNYAKDIAELNAKVNLLSRQISDLRKEVAAIKTALEQSSQKPGQTAPAPAQPSESAPVPSTGKPKGNDSVTTAKLLADFDRRFQEAESLGTTAAKEAAAAAVKASMRGTEVTLTCSVEDVGFYRESNTKRGTIQIKISRPVELPDKWNYWGVFNVPGTEDQALKVKLGDNLVIHGTLGEDSKEPDLNINTSFFNYQFYVQGLSYSVIAPK